MFVDAVPSTSVTNDVLVTLNEHIAIKYPHLHVSSNSTTSPASSVALMPPPLPPPAPSTIPPALAHILQSEYPQYSVTLAGADSNQAHQGVKSDAGNPEAPQDVAESKESMKEDKILKEQVRAWLSNECSAFTSGSLSVDCPC